jgi:CTP:phosphocholine cytidylyltransferase-like protein
MLFGNYWHGGVTTVKDAGGNTIQTIPYYTSVTQGDTKIWVLTTVAPNALATNGYSDKTSTTKKELILTLNGTYGVITSATGSTNTYLANGTSTYNAPKLLQNRKILLNYKYVSGANTYYCQDTLTFRNRLRDGVNEWQDENPSHY